MRAESTTAADVTRHTPAAARVRGAATTAVDALLSDLWT